MKAYEHTHAVLLKVIEEDIPLNLAIKSSLKKEKKIIDPTLKADISASAGCVLRHYYLFKELFSRKYPEEKESVFLFFALGLGNRLFSKRFDEEELKKYIQKNTELDGLVEYYESFNDVKKLIPEDVEFGSNKYYSMRYNTPTWIVRMWRKNAGDLLFKRLMHSQANYASSLLRVNTDNIKIGEFTNKYNDLSLLDEKLGIVSSSENRKVKRHQAVMNGDALVVPTSYSFMLDELDVDPVRGIAIYGGSTNHLLDELYVRLGVNFKADYLCGTQKHFFEVNDKVKKYGLLNLSVYECDYQAIITCVSKPVHTFFLCPENSYFLGLLENPDYFLRCRQDDLDRFINGQYQSLIEASRHVEDGGDLVYFVPTFCRNEGKGVIHRFINEHSDFVLVNEKQLFPFDKYQTMLYFAILRKEVKHD